MKTVSLKDLGQIWDFLEPIKYSFRGFLLILFSAELYATLISYLITEKISKEFSFYSLFYVHSTLVLVYIVIEWFYIRRLPKIQKYKLGILIAPILSDYTIDKEIVILKTRLDNLVKSEFPNYEFRIVRLPPNHAPHNDLEAHNLRDRSNAALIIWGQLESGNVAGSSVVRFNPIKFSYRVRLAKDQLEPFNQNINNILAQRRWIISEKETLVDRSYLVNNIEDVSLIILSLVLYFARLFKPAKDILEKLIDRFRSRACTPDEERTLSTCKFMLITIFAGEAVNLQLLPNDFGNSKKIDQAKELILEMKKYDDKGYLLLSAQVNYLLGNLENAIEDLKKAIDELPKNDPAPRYGLAFVNFVEGNFQQALLQTKKVTDNKMNPIGIQFPSIISWYVQTLDNDPSKRYLNFPIGFLYYYEASDFVSAEKALREFLDDYKTTNDQYLKQMISEAESILSEIHKKI